MTPLCSGFAAISLSTRQMSSTKRATQSHGPLLKVRPFKLAPKRPVVGPVYFADIQKPQPATDYQSQDQAHILRDSAFQNALIRHNQKKAMRSRRHQKVVHVTARKPHPICHEISRSDRRAKRRSIPFDEERDLDPWMLFPNLQCPNSALKNDSTEYIRQATEAHEAKEERYRVRGDPLSVDELKDMVHMTFNLGKYATPSRRMPSTPETISEGSFSPMDID